jgi:hypothetical protein
METGKVEAEVFCETKTHNQHNAHKYRGRQNKMSKKMDKEHIQELKEMVQEKKPGEPVEKVLVKFCERHGVSLEACRVQYNRLVEKGEVEEK